MSHDEWATPIKMFKYLESKFNFYLDAAATKENAKCEHFFTKEDDALKRSWCVPPNRSVFCNPPYTLDKQFAGKAYSEFYEHSRPSCLILPVRSDRIWFQEMMHNRDAKLCWVTGRIHFGGSKKGAFMYTVIAYWHNYVVLPPYIDASELNDSGVGGAKT